MKFRLQSRSVQKHLKNLSLLYIAFAIIMVPGVGGVVHSLNSVDPNKKYIPIVEEQFKLAAELFWKNRGDLTSNTDCRPKDVQIRYYNDPNDRAMQKAPPNGAYRDKVPYGSYCWVMVNQAYPDDNIQYGCVTFLHEYGHLLGKAHSRNVRSPMYTGYEKAFGEFEDQSHARFVENRKHIMADSLCSTVNAFRIVPPIIRNEAYLNEIELDNFASYYEDDDPVQYTKPSVKNPLPPPTPPACAVSSVPSLEANQCLLPGQSLRSAGGKYHLDLQTAGNLVTYNTANQAVWYNYNHEVAGSAQLYMQPDGNLVQRSTNGGVIWQSGTYGRGGVRVTLQDDGNLVMFNGAGYPVWSTFTGIVHGDAPAPNSLCTNQQLRPGQYLLSPDRKYKFTLQTAGNLVVSNANYQAIWHNNDSTYNLGKTAGNLYMQPDGNLIQRDASGAPVWFLGYGSGATCLFMQDDGNLVLRTASGAPVWSTMTGPL